MLVGHSPGRKSIVRGSIIRRSIIRGSIIRRSSTHSLSLSLSLSFSLSHYTYIYILDVRWGFAPPDFVTPITGAKQIIYSEKTPSGGANAKHLTLFPCPLVTVFSCLRSLDMLFSGSLFSCPSLFIVLNFLF